MKRIFVPLILAWLLFIGNGCVPYKIPTQNWICTSCEQPERSGNQIQCAQHWLYQLVPRHRSQIQWFDAAHWATWLLFGNDDDGLFGEGCEACFRTDAKPSLAKAVVWNFRNPLHNLCFYVLGTAAYDFNAEYAFVRLSNGNVTCFHKSSAGQECVFAGEGNSFFLGLHGGKPFISLRLVHTYRYKTDIYAGWRCRGNFGVKLILWGKREECSIK